MQFAEAHSAGTINIYEYLEPTLIDKQPIPYMSLLTRLSQSKKNKRELLLDLDLSLRS